MTTTAQLLLVTNHQPRNYDFAVVCLIS